MTLDTQHKVLYVCLATTLLVGTYLFADHRAESARTEAAVAKAQLAQVQTANATFQAQVSAQLNQLQAQNDSLTKALSARQQTEKVIPTQNGSLTPPQVATGIQTATGGKNGEATSNGQFIQLDLPLARTALTDMELVPLLQADKSNLSDQLSNEQKSLALEQSAHQSDLKTSKTSLDSAQADLKSCKANLTKSRMKWFGIGVVVGFVGRTLVTK